LQVWLAPALNAQEVLDVHQPERLIEVPFAKRVARVLRIDRDAQILFEGIFRVEKDNFAPRRRDIANHAFAEVERID
jgi:hypothetical protein